MLSLLLAGADSELESAITEEAEHVSGIFTGLLNTFRSWLPSLSFAAVILVCGVLLVKILMKMVEHGMKNSAIDPTASGFLESLIRVVLYLLVAVIVLSVLNVPMTSIVTIIGTAGLAIGLALQDSLSNVAGGFIILFSKPLKVGDFVDYGGITGTVETIGILQTKMRKLDGTTIFIPNRKISDAVILNYSEHELRRLDLTFGISYESDFEAAKAVIHEVLRQNPAAMDFPAPLVRVGELADSAVVLHVKVWTKNDDYWSLYYDLHEQVKSAFDAAGILIPFSQIDVHFHDSEKNFKKIEKKG